jgi:hypothetical protein
MVIADKFAMAGTSLMRRGAFRLAFHDPSDSELTD